MPRKKKTVKVLDSSHDKMARIPAILTQEIDRRRAEFNEHHGLNISFNAAVVQLLNEALED